MSHVRSIAARRRPLTASCSPDRSMSCSTSSPRLPQIQGRSGRVRSRSPLDAPRVPMSRRLRDFVPVTRRAAGPGLGLPRATPDDIAARPNQEINAALVDPTIKTRFVDLGIATMPGSPCGFAKLIAEETGKMKQGHQDRRHQAGVMQKAPIHERTPALRRVGDERGELLRPAERRRLGHPAGREVRLRAARLQPRAGRTSPP